MVNTTAARRILITGREAADIARRVNRNPHFKHWSEVQDMSECRHGCKLYARRRGCVTQYELFHNKSYGCDLGRNPETRRVPVSVAPKARLTVEAVDDQLLNDLGSATPGTNGALVDDELNALLLAWRYDSEAEPLPDLVDVPTAIATIQRGAA